MREEEIITFSVLLAEEECGLPRFARNDGCEVGGLPRFARNDGCEVTGLPRFPSVARNDEKKGGSSSEGRDGGAIFIGKAARGRDGGGRWIALVALVVCNRRIGGGNQIFYLFILQERNGEAKMVCDMARNENGGLLRMEGSGRIRSGGQGGEIQGVRDQARS